VPASKKVNIGVWESGRFIGVVIFGMGICPSYGRRYGLTRWEVCELLRIALTAHKTPVSRIATIAIRMLKKHSPGIRLLISFADPYMGHNGAIYQAMNFIYTGTSDPTTIYVDEKTGKVWHTRNIVFDSEKKYRDPWATRYILLDGKRGEKRPGKHRYLFPLDKEMRKRVAPLAQPYPKREHAVEPTGVGA